MCGVFNLLKNSFRVVDALEGILSVTLFGVQLPPNEIIITTVMVLLCCSGMVFWGDFLNLFHKIIGYQS